MLLEGCNCAPIHVLSSSEEKISKCGKTVEFSDRDGQAIIPFSCVTLIFSLKLKMVTLRLPLQRQIQSIESAENISQVCQLCEPLEIIQSYSSSLWCINKITLSHSSNRRVRTLPRDCQRTSVWNRSFVCSIPISSHRALKRRGFSALPFSQ